MLCKACKTQFQQGRKWQKYCSAECRKRSWDSTGYSRKWRKRNKAHFLKTHREYQRIYRAKHPESVVSYLNRQYKSKYGISLMDKQKMYLKQKCLCGLCGKALPSNYRKAHVDHDHATGALRMLLHSNCNRKLAVVEDRDFLVRAELYLRLCEHLKGV